jgi:hypothetical protein
MTHRPDKDKERLQPLLRPDTPLYRILQMVAQRVASRLKATADSPRTIATGESTDGNSQSGEPNSYGQSPE